MGTTLNNGLIASATDLLRGVSMILSRGTERIYQNTRLRKSRWDHV